MPPGPRALIRSFGAPGTGGEAGGWITWLANMPPPLTLTWTLSGTITVTVPNRLKI